MDLLKIGGLWENTDKNGNKYLSGNLTPTAKIMIMTNTYKRTDRDPAYILYLSKIEKKQDSPQSEIPVTAFTMTNKKDSYEYKDEIPF